MPKKKQKEIIIVAYYKLNPCRRNVIVPHEYRIAFDQSKKRYLHQMLVKSNNGKHWVSVRRSEFRRALNTDQKLIVEAYGPTKPVPQQLTLFDNEVLINA